jgi:P-loop Domain of unknown function (DUF2791)
MGPIDRAEAKAIVDSLRYGTPPVGHVREFTVGRQDELEQLEQSISAPDDGHGTALLVRANYGAGKSHLLRIVRERALEAGYAVALVITDANGGVRFNRMDTIFGAVSRTIEVPGTRTIGIASLFDLFRARFLEAGTREPLLRTLGAGGSWSQRGQLADPTLIGLRAWVVGGESQRSLVEQWFAWPEVYRNRRKDIYLGLVADLDNRFVDPRSESRYYIDSAFSFHTDAHMNAWNGLRDLFAIAVASGLKGLVLLFDEFEDVIQNLPRSNLQVAAFQNLFRFFSGTTYPGMAYFAVTPDFATACRAELLRRGVYDFPVAQFSKLPAFELAPITEHDFVELAGRIAPTHGLAYAWDATTFARGARWTSGVRTVWGRPEPDQIRRAIQGVVGLLDAAPRGR